MTRYREVDDKVSKNIAILAHKIEKSKLYR